MSAATITLGGPYAARWQRALPAFVLLMACLLFLYRDTALSMLSIWGRSDTYAHAFVVPPIVLWLLWRKRDALRMRRPEPAPWFVLAIAWVGLVWLLGDLAAVNAASQLAFTALLVLAVPAVLGVAVARTLLFPLAFLFFAVPIGDFMLPRMMLWTADFTAAALRLTGIPVFREGQQLVIPSGTWAVVEACSGVRYLMASMMVGTLFAYLNYRSLRRRLAFVALSAIVPIGANWLRAYLTVLLGHLTNNKLAAGADHLVYGWVFFGIVIVAMFAIGARWSEAAPPPGPAVATGAPAVAGPPHRAWAVAGLALLVAWLPQLALHALGSVDAGVSPALAPMEAAAGGWHRSDERLTEWRPAFRGASTEADATYVSPAGQRVGLYLAYYRHQAPDRKLVSSENVLVRTDDPRWLQVGSTRRTVDVAGRPVAFQTTELRGLPGPGRSTDNRLVAWHVYWINGRLTASEAWAKAYTALYRLAGRGDDAAVVLVYAREGVQTGEASAAIEDFLRDNLVAVESRLNRTREGDERQTKNDLNEGDR